MFECHNGWLDRRFDGDGHGLSSFGPRPHHTVCELIMHTSVGGAAGGRL
jgi:hypothetical protein